MSIVNNEMRKINSKIFYPIYNKIFIICAAYYKTGGTEVLHQLAYHINSLGGNAYMAYIRLYDVPTLCNPAFSKYVDDEHINEINNIEDKEGNAIIIPEGYPEYSDRYFHAVKMLWWLSVDNFEGIYGFDDKEIDKVHETFRKTIDFHLTQSEYSRLYLLKKGTPSSKIMHLADYINDMYFSGNDTPEDESPKREDIILYNPKKGEESTKNIVKASSGMKYVPLKDMTSEEIFTLMHKAKIYIDFGNHPGKDRIPREAAMCGLIVITGRHGSADNPVDIQIPDKYKLKEEDVTASEVVDTINDCLLHYDEYVRDFYRYKKVIKGEKEEFINDIKSVFFAVKTDKKTYDDINDNRILIVIVSYNQSHLTKACIESIRNTVPAGTYKIAVIDNASTDGSAEWLKEQEDIILICNDDNKGFAPACNIAVKATRGTEYENYDVFLLNNDTRLTENSLYFLKEALYSNDDVGAVGSISNYAGNRQQVDVTYDRVEEYLEYGKKNNVPLKKPYVERVRLSGFAMLIKRKAWNECGGFDEDFAPGYFEDDALSVELLKRGCRLLLVRNSFIYHAGSQSFSKVDYNSLLNEHRELFIKKYGFDIIDYAYADEASYTALDEKGDAFKLLQVGCGLGADLKAIRSIYPGCETVGIEPDNGMLEIAKHTETIFGSIKEMATCYEEGHFDVLFISDKVKSELSGEDKGLIMSRCRKDVMILTGNEAYKNFPFEKIKLIIWDLDDTLWRGIISEGETDLPLENIALIHELADHGIVNSISSKNDIEPVEAKLKEAGIYDLFVFNNINWNEKGTQIADKMSAMGLRAENTLFIDDNARNLEEAVYSNKGLMIAGPSIIPYLANHYKEVVPKDKDHTRLAQYKLLERKTVARNEVSGLSKEQFLYESNIKITINLNCFEEIDRIHDMVMRTNQLNYTKHRDDKELLTRQITNDWNDCAYIKVRDKFGDYGIVGFFCYNRREKVMEHFLFSCRVLGMGIEQYVYDKLGCPDFEVAEPVASALLKDKKIPWISETVNEAVTVDNARNRRVRLLLKGPCDMSAIEPYLAGANITTEFNYINEFGFITTGQNHTMHIRQSIELSSEEIDSIVKDAPFIIKGDFETKLFSEKYHVICLSMLQDLQAGLYRNIRSGHYISFSSMNFNLTDPTNKSRFVNKEIQGHNYDFTKEVIDEFSDKWEFIGNTPIDMLLSNLDFIYDNVQGKPLIILLLGSERECDKNTEEFAGLCEIYRNINPVIEAFAQDHERVITINPTQFIHSQEDYGDCINHYSRNVYYEIAGRIADCINRYL